MTSERKSFTAFAATAALLLSSLPALAAPLASMAPLAQNLSNVGSAAAAAPLAGATLIVTNTVTGNASTPFSQTAVITGTGTGFAPSALVAINCVPSSTCPATGVFAASGNSDASGNFTFTVPITVPAGTPPSILTFQAFQSGSTTPQAQATFTVLPPTLFISPASANTGTPVSVAVTGTGYISGTTVTISCNPAASCPTSPTAPVTSTGNIATTLVLTSTTAGAVLVQATESGTTGVVTSTTFTFSNPPPPPPTLGITTVPTNGVPLQSVAVNGTGFVAGQPVTVTFTPPSGVAPTNQVITTTGGGSFSASLFVPAGTAAGAATISAITSTGSPVTTTFTVLAPSVTTVPTSTVPSGSFVVTGTGFSANVPVTVTLGITGATAVVTNSGALVDSNTGSFVTSLSVPANAAPGNYIVRAVDATGLSATAPFAVTPITATTGGSLTLVPVNGQSCGGTAQANVVPSAPVNAFLSGFNGGETVSVILNGVVVTTTVVAANGSGIGVFTINNSGTANATSYTVSAIGNSSGKVATATLAQCPVTQTATPSTVTPGQGVTLTGTGFGAGETVSETVYLASTTPVTVGAGAPGVTFAFTGTANSTGAVSFATPFTPTAFGVFTARSTGVATGLSATTTFTVTPAGVSAVSGPVFPCTSFVISATNGFSPTEIVTLQPLGGTAVTSTVNSSGGFVATLTAPANTPVGNLPVVISSPSRGVFTATQPITVPTAALQAVPGTAAFGSSTTVNGTGFIPGSQVNLALYFAGATGSYIPAGGTGATVTASVAGAFTATLSLSPTVQVVNGTYVISGTSSCSPANTATTPVTITIPGTTPSGTPTAGPGNQPTTVYFAEGYTGRFATNAKADFDEFISVLNPDNFTKTVTFTYQLQPSGVAPITTTTVFSQAIGPNTDILRSVNGDVGNDQIVSAIVSSNGRIAAERIINRTAPSGRLDADSSLGNTTPGTTWYFAEGYTGASFQEYLTVQNLATSTATYTVTFLPPSVPAATPRQLAFTVPAGGRDTQNIRRLYLPFLQPGVAVRGGGESVGMIINSTQPIVAERVMYWGDGVGSAKYGASSKAGLTAPQTQFIFAFGSNPGTTPSSVGAAQMANDESYVTVVNPAPALNAAGTAPNPDATVLVKFYNMSGTFLGSKSITVSPQTRETVVVNNVIPTLTGPFYTIVTSDLPVFVEKPNYVGGSPNAGKHPGMSPSGSPAGLQSVLFPNVNTASAAGQPISETVFLVNTSATAETIVGTYYTPGGATAQVSYVLNPGAMQVVNVNADAGNLPAGPLGAQYTTGFGGQFVAARISSTTDGMSYIGNQGVFNQ